MIRHYLKLIWNRKRSNLLVAVEIFFSFLVVFAVVATAAYYANNFRRPLGYSIEDVWVVSVDSNQSRLPWSEVDQSAINETRRQLHLAVGELPEVTAIAECFTVPYGNGRWGGVAKVGGRDVWYSRDGVTDGFAEVFGLSLVRGRWFARDDDAAGFEPVVINEKLAALAFGAEDPIGKAFPANEPDEAQKEQRVVGVISEFRQDGELALPEGYMLTRVRPGDSFVVSAMGNIVLKLRPGTTVAFEEGLVKRMRAVAKDWSFEVQPAVQMREQKLRDALMPLIAGGVIAGFLMLMVASGLTGVVWQSVTQRTREIGLRRAKGATVPDIRRQIVGELAVVTTLAVLPGALIVAQLPILGAVQGVTAGVFASSLVISALCIYLLTLASAWYPSRMATSISPAEALHYE